MKIQAEEITAILEKELNNFDTSVDVKEVGQVLQVGDSIAQVYGLENAMAGEILKFPHGVFGVVFNLEENNVGAVILGRSELIREGDTVERTGRILDVPTGQGLLGRVVDPLGNPIDGQGPIESTNRRPIERVAPGVCDRYPVSEPLQTGINQSTL